VHDFSGCGDSDATAQAWNRYLDQVYAA